MGLQEPPSADRLMLPPGTLKGQVALVTGGGTGLGLGMATAFARLGASVGIVSRSQDNLDLGLDALDATGAPLASAIADVRDADQVAAAFDRIEQALGPVSILANNAGANFPVLATEMSPNAWRAITQIALDGTFFCSAEFARRRTAAGLPGAIVNNAATYAWTGLPGDAHAAAAKAGVVNLTRSLAVEWADDGIRVNCIAAGFFPHPRSPSYNTADPDEPMGRMTPAGRCGRMHELGWAAAYLCSPFAAYVSGHTLTIDGGEWLRRGLRMPEFTPPRERESLW